VKSILLSLTEFLSRIWSHNPVNFPEVVEQLKHEDELTLLELLEITSEDLVDAFRDRIEDNINKVYRHLSG
jgi:hypothetical protein